MAGVAITLAELRDRVCHFLGYGASYSAATATRQSDTALVVRDGLRNFYNARRWLFMRPLRAVTTDAYSTALDADIAAVHGDGYLIGADGHYDFPVIQTSSTRLINMREQHPESTTRPRYFAVTPSIVETTTGNELTTLLLLYPEPSEEVTMTFRAMLRLSDIDNSVLIGSDLHADVMIEACLSLAEQRRDDVSGIHTMQYEQKLEAAKLRDADQFGGSYVGYMGDASDGAGSMGLRRDPNGPIDLNL